MVLSCLCRETRNPESTMKITCPRSASSRTFPRAGFTLIELLVVIAIIAILVGIIMRLAGFASRKSAVSKAIGDIEQLSYVMTEYGIQKGAFWSNSGPLTANQIGGVYLTNELAKVARDLKFIDPWGKSYVYTNSGGAFSFSSEGLSTNSYDDINSVKEGY